MRDWRGRLGDLKAAQEQGVVFSSVCLISDRFIGDLEADRRREAVEHMKSLLSGIAELGGIGAITPAAFGLTSKALPPFKAPRTEDEDRRVLLEALEELGEHADSEDRKSTRLNSSHANISYAVFCLKKKKARQ